jgi:hypothetical protein
MARLTSDHKRLIVQRLATFATLTEIREELLQLGADASLSQIMYYDPDSKGTHVADEWRTLHAETRERFIVETAGIAISHQSFRLRELERLYRKTASGTRANVVLGAQLLKQAAEEVGGAFTNRREVTGKDGKPFAVALDVRFVRPQPATPAGVLDPSPAASDES